MEKITEQINKNSMNITVLQFTVAQQEDRLKTLEDKVKFIMENTDKEIFEQTGMQEADSKWVKLQDLWDEQLEEPLVECHHQCSGNCRRVGCNCSCGEYHDERAEQIKPTVKEDRIPDDKLEWEPTVKECDSIPVVISYGKEEKIEEIISEYNKNFPDDMFRYQYYKESTEEWLRDKLKEL